VHTKIPCKRVTPTYTGCQTHTHKMLTPHKSIITWSILVASVCSLYLNVVVFPFVQLYRLYFWYVSAKASMNPATIPAHECTKCNSGPVGVYRYGVQREVLISWTKGVSKITHLFYRNLRICYFHPVSLTRVFLFYYFPTLLELCYITRQDREVKKAITHMMTSLRD